MNKLVKEIITEMILGSLGFIVGRAIRKYVDEKKKCSNEIYTTDPKLKESAEYGVSCSGK